MLGACAPPMNRQSTAPNASSFSSLICGLPSEGVGAVVRQRPALQLHAQNSFKRSSLTAYPKRVI